MVIVGEKAADVGAVDAASRVTTYARACVRRSAMTSSRTRKGARQPVDGFLSPPGRLLLYSAQRASRRG